MKHQRCKSSKYQYCCKHDLPAARLMGLHERIQHTVAQPVSQLVLAWAHFSCLHCLLAQTSYRDNWQPKACCGSVTSHLSRPLSPSVRHGGLQHAGLLLNGIKATWLAAHRSHTVLHAPAHQPLLRPACTDCTFLISPDPEHPVSTLDGQRALQTVGILGTQSRCLRPFW